MAETSLCYQLPLIFNEGTAIIVSPLIALMKNQVDAIRGFSDQDGIAHFLNSSLNKADILKVKKDVTDGKTKLLYVAPETLTKEDNLAFFKEFKFHFLLSTKRIVFRSGDMIFDLNTAVYVR